MLLAFVVVSPAAIILLSITRLLIVSNYQTTTAIAVASTSGAVTTLLGTLIPLVPVFLPYAAILLLVAAIRYWFTLGANTAGRLLIGSGLCFAATFLVCPTSKSLNEIRERGSAFIPTFRTALLILAALVILSMIVTGILSRGSDDPTLNVFSAFLGTLGLGLGGLLVAFLVVLAIITFYAFPIPQEARRIPEVARKVWLPPERIGLNEANQTIVGYVLSTADDWFTILREADRTVVRIPSDDIKSRLSVGCS
jgi:uncharacterized protein (UPF0297 family)